MPPRSFSPTRAMGIPPMDYADFWDGDGAVSDPSVAAARPPDLHTTGRDMLFKPDRGYSGRPLMATQFDPLADEFQQAQTTAALQKLRAQQGIQQNGADALLGPRGRNQRLDYMLQGAISPEQERTIEHFETAPDPRLSKYSPVPVEVAQAASELDYIDPTEPGALEKRNQLLREIDQHPEWGGSNLKTHPYFQAKDEKFLHNFYAHRNLVGTEQRSAERSDLGEIHQALVGGASPDALRPYLDPDMRRITDHAGFAQIMAQAAHNKAVLTPKAKQKMLELQVAANNAASPEYPSVPQKQAWLTANGIDPLDATGPQWDAAYEALKVAPMQEFLSYKNSLGLHDFGAPREPQQSAEPIDVPSTAPSEPAGDQVTTLAQFNALPVGSVFVSNGKTYRKK